MPPRNVDDCAYIAPYRTEFVFKGYRKGVIAFIDLYWHMIHRAAGWGALRAFLLVRDNYLGVESRLHDDDVWADARHQ